MFTTHVHNDGYYHMDGATTIVPIEYRWDIHPLLEVGVGAEKPGIILTGYARMRMEFTGVSVEMLC